MSSSYIYRLENSVWTEYAVIDEKPLTTVRDCGVVYNNSIHIIYNKHDFTIGKKVLAIE